MSNHFLTTNADNESVCRCGFRPAVLDDPAIIGRGWKARSDVEGHVRAFRPSFLTRSPREPFHARHERRYPRAGVRRREDGIWIITLWDEEGVMHAWENKGNEEHHNRLDAFEFAHWFIKSHQELGVRLNGMANA